MILLVQLRIYTTRDSVPNFTHLTARSVNFTRSVNPELYSLSYDYLY